MKIRHYYFYILTLFTLQTFAQDSINIGERYQKYYKLAKEEAVHLHLNKTTYLVGEEIWFKAYIFNKRDEEASNVSSKLFVGLYDEDGMQVMQQLFRIENGLANGNILLEKSLNSGTYYLKAATHEMIKNHPEEAYVEELIIYGNSVLTEKFPNSEPRYDIQFLPEGGHMVKNVENTIAFKAIDDNGKGVYIYGTIHDDAGEEVADFESNTYGIGTFDFIPKGNTAYKAKITINDKIETTKLLPKVEDTGIVMQVNNMPRDSVHIAMHANEETLRSIISKEYTLLVHKDGLSRSMPLSFKNNEDVTLKIARNRLFNGVNTITLFDGKTPILERLFFNRKVVKDLALMIKKTESEKDFSRFSLYLVKNKSGIRDANVSISVLPATTESNNPAQNIFSSFYLKPYIRGEVENPKYYFPNNTRTRIRALDALLITQGWSKYDWNDIFSKPALDRKTIYGITVKGTVNYPLKGVTGMFLHDINDMPAQYIPLDANRSFEVHNLFPEADEKLRFSYVDSKKRFSQPKLFLQYNVKNTADRLSDKINIDRSFLGKREIFALPPGFFPEDAEALSAVVIEGKNNTERRKTTDPMMVRGVETKITNAERMRYPTLNIFLQSNGFDMNEGSVTLGQITIFARRPSTLGGLPPDKLEARTNGQLTNPTPLNGNSTNATRESYRSAGTRVSPLVFVDNTPLTSFDMLASLNMANVERIIVDKTGIGYGLRGTGGVIKIFTRNTPLDATPRIPRGSYMASSPPIGFSKPKQYYQPKYRSFSSDTYQKYGAMDWRPNVYIPRRGPCSIVLNHKDTNVIHLLIEGISRDGSLISTRRTITIDEDK